MSDPARTTTGRVNKHTNYDYYFPSSQIKHLGVGASVEFIRDINHPRPKDTGVICGFKRYKEGEGGIMAIILCNSNKMEYFRRPNQYLPLKTEQ